MIASWRLAYAGRTHAAKPGPVEDYNLVQSLRVFYGATEAEFGVTDMAWAELPKDR